MSHLLQGLLRLAAFLYLVAVTLAMGLALVPGLALARAGWASGSLVLLGLSIALGYLVFGLTFLVMIYSVIPWSDFFPAMDTHWLTWAWYFPELAALFLVMSIVVGLIGGLGEERMVGAIVAGMGDFMGAALIIAIARGVTVIMNNSGITDTVLNSLEGVVSGLSTTVFAIMMFVVNIPLAFLVPSSSGHATLAMPIMAPLADFAGVSRAIVVTAYQSASGWVNLFTPTSAIVMGGLALAKVRYDRYLRFVFPLLVILFVLIAVFLAIGAATGLGGPK